MVPSHAAGVGAGRPPIGENPLGSRGKGSGSAATEAPPFGHFVRGVARQGLACSRSPWPVTTQWGLDDQALQPAPPNWPPPPSPDWQPSAGWRPDPAWGPPPEGWQLWTDDDAKKNWFLRHKILTGLGALLFLLFVAIAGVSGGEEVPETPTAQTTPAPSEEAEATESAEALTPSPARSPTPTPTPTPEPEPEVVGFGDGTHRVGEDIERGTYRSDESSLCYWARLAGFSGELEDIIANGNSGPEIVTITEDDARFETSNCGDWVPVETTFPETPETSFEDGTFVADLTSSRELTVLTAT